MSVARDRKPDLRPGAPPEARPFRRQTLLWWSGGAVALLLLLLVAGLAALRHLQPVLRARLLQTFQERFHSPATLDDLQVYYDGQIQVNGRGLRVQSVLTGVPGDPLHPMLQVQEFHFHTGLLQALSRSPRIHHVRIRGVQLNLPPEQAQQHSDLNTNHMVNLEYAEVDDAHIHFDGSSPDRAPLQFDLPHIVLRGVSRSRPIRFHAVVDNGPPIGITETDGTIGPWNFDDPRLTPLQGAFGFRDRDMSSTRGVHGRLTLNGVYRGTVGNMHVEGTTDDPAFALDVSSHPVRLRTRFALTMLPAQNSVALNRVEGSFGNTRFVCSGLAVKDGAAGSFRLDLQLDAPTARLEDALALATRTSPPAMRGALALSGRLQMRAGPESVSRKLALQHATFTVADGTFGNGGVQQSFDELAERAQGDPGGATRERAARGSASLSGAVRLQDGVLQFSGVRASAPGTEALLHGSYSLSSTQFLFTGSVHTEATISHMAGGVKSLLLKPFNGILGHSERGGATLPLRIEGADGVPHVSTRLAGIKVKVPGTK